MKIEEKGSCIELGCLIDEIGVSAISGYED